METVKIKSYSQIMKEWKDGKLKAIPSNIENVDEMIGGIVPGILSVIWGESGSGKTLFCCNLIKNVLNKNESSKVLYVDFESNLRLITLEKLGCDLERIDFFQPKILVEQILFFQVLQERTCDYSLIIIDSSLGAPLQQLKYIYLEQNIWSTKVFNFFLSLKSFASKSKIPIVLTCHTPENPQELEKDLLKSVAPVQIFLSKESSKFKTNFYFYSEEIGGSEFILIF
ncbi:MAG: RAD55 family ATPase [Candidatus Hodarchaeales archaeon]